MNPPEDVETKPAFCEQNTSLGIPQSDFSGKLSFLLWAFC